MIINYSKSKAMKMMEKFEQEENESAMTPELSKIAQNELRLMKQINHENIIKYFDHFDQECFDTDYLCIISEFCQVLQFYLLLKLLKIKSII